MPHKRQKRSARDEQRSQKGANHAPNGNSISTEAIPKSVARVLNAATVREQYKSNKRKLEEDGPGTVTKKRRKGAGSEVKSKALAIQPGESLAHFNRRVEDDMRPLVRSAMQSSSASAVERRARKKELEVAQNSTTQSDKSSKRTGTQDRVPPSSDSFDKHSDKPKEFTSQSSAAPRRLNLNDVASAPPELKLKKARVSEAIGGNGKAGVLSLAQRAMMEEERENAIRRYRELKERR
ncbi:hypothetical protein OF83DRAFT_1044040, partial [Amylostereum chailletii]